MIGQRFEQEALRETSALLHAVVEESPLAIVAMNLEFDVTRRNAAAERLFGWTADEIVGDSSPQTIPRTRFEEHAVLHDRALRGGTATNIETRQRRKDGSLVGVSVSLAALHDAEGVVTGVVAIVADVTEWKYLEAQVRQGQKIEAVGQPAGASRTTSTTCSRRSRATAIASSTRSRRATRTAPTRRSSGRPPTARPASRASSPPSAGSRSCSPGSCRSTRDRRSPGPDSSSEDAAAVLVLAGAAGRVAEMSAATDVPPRGFTGAGGVPASHGWRRGPVPGERRAA